MKIFIDSANLTDIEEALKRGFPRGITTNPSILAKEPKGNFLKHIEKIVELVKRYKYQIPLSVEVFSTEPKEMLAQADEILKNIDYKFLNIKVPIGWNELEVIRELRARNVEVNCTCCMNYNQAVMASLAGANFVSLFYGRIRDVGYDAFSVVKKVRDTFKEWESSSQIIVGSIRHIMDVSEAAQAGADIITVPPKFFRELVKHPKTDEAVNQFLTDFKSWLS